MVHGYPEIHGYPRVLEARWLAQGFTTAPLWTSAHLTSQGRPPKKLRILDPWSLDPRILDSIFAASYPWILEVVLEGSAGLGV